MLAALNRFFSGAPQPAKAETGPGVYGLMNYPPLSSIADNPVNKIAEAQAIFRLSPWVAGAERAIVGRYVDAGYHLEDSKGNTVGEDGPAKAVKDFIDNPAPGWTRKRLWKLTLRHEGVAGNHFWALDQRLPNNGPPLATLPINAARMTPVENEAGVLIGWIMDHPQNPVSQRRNLRNPVPFELEELRHFILDDPDWGHYGIGWVEAAYDQIKLDELATKHVAQVFAAGGRIAGLLSPKPNVSVSDEQWKQLVADWRSISNDPDAAKRLLIARGPVDFTSTAANPNELQMKDILTLSRDNVFAAAGVPISQGAGVVAATGLNSGEAMKYEEAALWQGPIDYRAASFEENLQSIIDLFGLGLKLVIEKPAFDDQAPLFVNAEKAKEQPLTNNERRALLGFDPLEDDELGKAIFIASTMTKLTIEDPQPPQAFGLPPRNPSTPTSQEDATPEDAAGDAAQPVKADLRAMFSKRLMAALQTFLVGQANSIANRVKNNHAHLVARPLDTKSWWNERQWDKELASVIEPFLADLANSTSRKVGKQFAPAKAGWVDSVVAFVIERGADRVAGINATTRDSIARIIAAGIEAGTSPADLAQQIRDATAFNEARAEVIARTETAIAYNESALRTYDHYEVKQVEAIDGDHDDECAARNGSVYSVDEAYGIQDHPNGTLDWIPVTKASLAEPLKAQMGLPQITIPLTVEVPKPDPVEVTVNVPKPEPVVVNVPEVKVPPAEVTVNVPEQAAPVVNVEAAKATTPQEVIVTSMPARAHVVKRNRKGEVTGSTEVDA